jgi:hypothetical protein
MLDWWNLMLSTLPLCVAYALLFSAAVDRSHLFVKVLVKEKETAE